MKYIDDLLNKQMSRTEFLRVIGLSLLALVGVNNFLSFIGRNSSDGHGQAARADKEKSFGSRTFGN